MERKSQIEQLPVDNVAEVCRWLPAKEILSLQSASHTLEAKVNSTVTQRLLAQRDWSWGCPQGITPLRWQYYQETGKGYYGDYLPTLGRASRSAQSLSYLHAVNIWLVPTGLLFAQLIKENRYLRGTAFYVSFSTRKVFLAALPIWAGVHLCSRHYYKEAHDQLKNALTKLGQQDRLQEGRLHSPLFINSLPNIRVIPLFLGCAGFSYGLDANLGYYAYLIGGFVFQYAMQDEVRKIVTPTLLKSKLGNFSRSDPIMREYRCALSNAPLYRANPVEHRRFYIEGQVWLKEQEMGGPWPPMSPAYRIELLHLCRKRRLLQGAARRVDKMPTALQRVAEQVDRTLNVEITKKHRQATEQLADVVESNQLPEEIRDHLAGQIEESLRGERIIPFQPYQIVIKEFQGKAEST